MEDFARLVREDKIAAEWLKTIRHRLGSTISTLDRNERLRARSAESDAGTEVHAQEELKRSKLEDVIPAAAERITQALRNLEEYGKLLSPEFGQEIKSLRYAAYDLLAKAELRLMSESEIDDCQLYLLIDCKLERENFSSYVAALAKSGVDVFQIRDKSADGSKLIEYSRLALKATQGSKALVIVNDRIDVALATGAHGVHLGQEDISLSVARQLINQSSHPNLVVGISTHDMQQVIEAEQGGADYIGCGPTFPSQTKSFEAFAGPEFITDACAKTGLPAFAIGGITQENLDRVLASGCQRIAVSGVIHQSDEPLKTARALKERLVEASCAAQG